MGWRAKTGVAAGVVLAAAVCGYFYFPNPWWPTDRLIRSAKNGNDTERLICVGALRDRARGSEEALAALVLALGDNWDEVRGSASAALCAVGEPAIPFLQQSLKSEDQRVRETAAMTLNCIIPNPK